MLNIYLLNFLFLKFLRGWREFRFCLSKSYQRNIRPLHASTGGEKSKFSGNLFSFCLQRGTTLRLQCKMVISKVLMILSPLPFFAFRVCYTTPLQKRLWDMKIISADSVYHLIELYARLSPWQRGTLQGLYPENRTAPPQRTTARNPSQLPQPYIDTDYPKSALLSTSDLTHPALWEGLHDFLSRSVPW